MDAFGETRSRGFVAAVVLAVLWSLWKAIRLPLLGFLLVLAPFVRIVLVGFATVGVFTALICEFGGPRPFPFFGMLAVYLGALAVLWL